MANQAAFTAEHSQQVTITSLEEAFNGGLEYFKQHLSGMSEEQSLRLCNAIEVQLSSK